MNIFNRSFHPLKWILLISVLSSCTIVNDFGKYWSKGVLDTALEGTWINKNNAGKTMSDIAPNDRTQIIKKDDLTYLMVVYDGDSSGKYKEKRFPMRTLNFGKHKMMMLLMNEKQNSGVLVRYAVSGGIFRLYVLRTDKALAYYLKTFKKDNAFKIEGGSAVINYLNEDIYRFYSQIVDKEEFWQLDSSEYMKTS